MRFLVLLFVLLCISCAHYPEDESFRSLIDRESLRFKGKYIIHVYDCSNMSYDLAIRLRELGYEADLYAYEHGFTGHAIVRILYKGKYYYSDPARRWSFIREPSGKVYGIFSPYEIPQRWVDEFKGHL